MSDKWKFGSYTFVINPNSNSENINYIGDNAVSLNGTVISMPTVRQEQYSFSSIFFQGMPRILNQVSIPNGIGIEILSGNYYVLNNSNKRIDKYNTNFSLLGSTSVSVSGNANLLSFDIKNDGSFVVVDDATNQTLYRISSSGNTNSSITGLDGTVQGIKAYNGYYWMVTSNDTFYQTDESLNIINHVSLPYIASDKFGYRGMTVSNGYIVVSFNASDIVGAYHIDKDTGNIVNAFSLPSYIEVYDVAYDGQNFIFSTRNNNQLVYTNGNTVLADVYTLENNIRNNGYLYMIDDMDVTRKVSVSNYSIERKEGFAQMYDVSITVNKIDRG